MNIGDSLVALHYYLPMTEIVHHLYSPPAHYSAKLVQTFSSVSATNSPGSQDYNEAIFISFTLLGISNSPLHNMLPVDVYCEDQLLVEVCDVKVTILKHCVVDN